MKLVLDEMHSPLVARALRSLGYNAMAIAEQPTLRALPDPEVYAFAVAEDRCLVTENVKDFHRLHARAEQAGAPLAWLLYTSTRTFPRTRRNIDPLVDALAAWLDAPHSPLGGQEWLRPC